MNSECGFDPGVGVARGAPVSADGRAVGPVAGAEGAQAVSYTHLRAHETVLDLVCRLLLEKKKTTQYELQVYHLEYVHYIIQPAMSAVYIAILQL